jgi:hypothetical protein
MFSCHKTRPVISRGRIMAKKMPKTSGPGRKREIMKEVRAERRAVKISAE